MPRLIITLYVLFFAGALSAQLPPLPHAINYTVEDGLPSSEVYFVMEDSRGYMWFGTDNGVARFDGYEFRTYQEADGLEDLVVFSIKEGPDGHIYACAGKSARIFVWRESTDRFTPFGGNPALREEALRVNNIHAKLKAVHPGGKVLVNLSTSGPVIVGKNGSLDKRYTPQFIGFATILENPTVEHSAVSFASEASRRSEKQLRADGTFKTYLKDSVGNLLHLQQFTSDDWKDFFYFFTFTTTSEAGDTIVVLTKDNLIRTNPLDHPELAREYPVSEKNRILFKYKVRKHAFLLGFDKGQGLRYYNNLSEYLNGDGRALIANCNASYATEDQHGGLWATTTDRGVFYFPNPDIGVYNERQGFPDTKAISIVTTQPNGVAVGYEDFHLLVSAKGPDGLLDIHKEHLTPYKPLTLYYDAPSQQVFSSSFHFDLKTNILRKNGSYQSADADLEYLGGIMINRYRPYGDTTLLIAGLAGPAQFSTHLRSKIPAFTHNFLNVSPYYLRTEDYRILPDGTHLLASRHGLHRWEDFDTIIQDNLGHPELDVEIRSIEILPDSSLLFATRGRGLIHLKNDSLTVIGKKEGLASENIRHLNVDSTGTIYVSTFGGLSILRFASAASGTGPPYSIRTYTTAHGLPSNEIHQTASGDGKVWLATSRGLVDFKEMPKDSVPVPPAVRQFRVNGEPWRLDTTIELAAGQNNLEINYSTIDLRLGGNIQYRYRLQDDDVWKYTRQRTVNLTDAAAGDYRFTVQSQNQDGFWSEAATLPFRIREYWYRTLWFRGLALAGLLLALYLSLHLRHRRIDREKGLKEQAAELERAALRAQMNPHFIFNCLNSINRFILKNEADNASSYLTRFAHLIRQTLNVSVQDQHTLHDEINMLRNYLELEKLRFKDRVNYRINIDPQLPLHRLVIPPLLIQPYVENALVHGLPEEKDSLIEIAFDKTATGLSVVITDNGKGIDPDKHTSNKSLGMRLTAQRLALMARNHPGVELTISRIDDAGGGGTRVAISIAAAINTNYS